MAIKKIAIIYKHFKYISKILEFDLVYFFKNGFWVILGQVIVSLGGLALSVAFARLVSKDVFGEYQLVLSILSIVSIVSMPGLSAALTRSVARGYEGDFKKVIRTRFYYSLVGIPILIIVGVYYYLHNNSDLGITLMLLSILFPFFYTSNSWDSFLKGEGRFDIISRYISVQAVINISVTIAAIFINTESIVWIMFFYVLSFSLVGSYYSLTVWRQIVRKKSNEETIKYGLFLTGTDAIWLIASNIDKILIGALLGITDLAIYTIVSMLSVRIGDFFKVLTNIFAPKLARHSQSLSNLIKRKITIVAIAIISVFSVLYYISVPTVSRVIFSEKYIEFYQLSRLFVFVIILALPLSFLKQYALAKKQGKVIFISNNIYILTKIILTVVLIKQYQLAGAIWAFNMSMLVWFLAYMILIIFDD